MLEVNPVLELNPVLEVNPQRSSQIESVVCGLAEASSCTAADTPDQALQMAYCTGTPAKLERS